MPAVCPLCPSSPWHPCRKLSSAGFSPGQGAHGPYIRQGGAWWRLQGAPGGTGWGGIPRVEPTGRSLSGRSTYPGQGSPELLTCVSFCLTPATAPGPGRPGARPPMGDGRRREASLRQVQAGPAGLRCPFRGRRTLGRVASHGLSLPSSDARVQQTASNSGSESFAKITLLRGDRRAESVFAESTW